ncbi:hypothetical protein Pcinc_037098, partial [Petrolisthes cinctipes]
MTNVQSMVETVGIFFSLQPQGRHFLPRLKYSEIHGQNYNHPHRRSSLRLRMSWCVAKVCVVLLLLGVVVSTMAQLHSVCSLNPPQYSCPSSDLLQMQFSGVNVESCGGNYSKSLFSELIAVTYTQAVQ